MTARCLHVLRLVASALLATSSLLVTQMSARADGVDVSPSGTTSIPALQIPSSPLMSAEGNASRVEHIATERSLKGRPIAEFNAALFGPRLEIARRVYAVTTRDETMAGVKVRTYEPRDGIAPGMRNRILLNVHGGGFVGCFEECGGLESIPIAALARARIISIDYRLAPAAKFPKAVEDVAAVYREVLKRGGVRRR